MRVQTDIVKARVKRVARLRKLGLSLTDISEQVGVPYTTVAKDIKRAKEAGIIVPLEPRVGMGLTYRILQRYELKSGTIHSVLFSLPTETRDWFLRQVPEGGVVSDMIAAMINDLYHEEMEGANDG